MPRLYNAIGLMSGTSLDGIDAALIETDGKDYASPEAFVYLPYEDGLREQLRSLLGQRESSAASDIAQKNMTEAHAACVDALLKKTGLDPSDIDVVGFHGQTLSHAPREKWTWQLGDGAFLARLCGIDVVNDFRSRDVWAGGEGAPFLPLYHRARIRSGGIHDPVAIVNIGGVSNVTWVGRDDEILAFDTGPGNALMDDVMLQRVGQRCDENGQVARRGIIDQERIDLWLGKEFFSRLPPKSLDRNAWQDCTVEDMQTADALATLASFTVQANIQAARFFPEPATAWYVTGGGRYNQVVMEGLRRGLDVPVKQVEALGWNGDGVEAEGFAYLAIRHLLDFPLSLPTTTGVPRPQTGGVLHQRPLSKD